jgi:hypothetical protein
LLTQHDNGALGFIAKSLLFRIRWTIFEGISAICPKMGRLSIQVGEELAQIFGIRG